MLSSPLARIFREMFAAGLSFGHPVSTNAFGHERVSKVHRGGISEENVVGWCHHVIS